MVDGTNEIHTAMLRKDLLKPSRENRLGRLTSIWKPNTNYLPSAPWFQMKGVDAMPLCFA
jgi:hypothetical protein